MKRILSIASVLFFAASLSTSTRAACGGGGYQPAPQPSNQAAVKSEASTAGSYASQTNASRASQSATAISSTLDTKRFNEISGRLGMGYKQATDVLNAMREIRSKESSGQKDYDSKKEFEIRLSQILTPKQYQTYQTSI